MIKNRFGLPARYTLKDIQNIADSRGGICLSDSYKNVKTLMKFECKEGHIWETKAVMVVAGHWCKKCGMKEGGLSHRKYSLEYIQKFAAKNDGKCLSDNKSFSTRERVKFECKKEHQWSARLGSVLSGSWCRKCRLSEKGQREKQKTFKKLEKICKEYGYQVLGKYKGSWNSIELMCNNGHKWKPRASCITSGQTGCPYCSKLVNQEKCRYILAELTKTEWEITYRIISPYQLDMYSERYKTAFEYNGPQHYKQVNMWHKKTGFAKQQERDKIKKQLCQEKSIRLFDIPYWKADNDYKLIEYIKECLVSVRIPLLTQTCDVKEFYRTYSFCNKEYEKIVAIALSKNGKCLSKEYINQKTKLEFECDKGHTWWATPSCIKQGHWCPKCAMVQRYSKMRDPDGLKKMQAIAKERGGECLSTEFLGCIHKLQFRCGVGHEWFSTPCCIRGSPNCKGSWCPKCARMNYKRGDHK